MLITTWEKVTIKRRKKGLRGSTKMDFMSLRTDSYLAQMNVYLSQSSKEIQWLLTCLVCPIPSTYTGMQSCIVNDDVASLPPHNLMMWWAPLLAKSDVGMSKQGSKQQTCVCQADVSQTCWPTCRQHNTKSCRPGYPANMTQHVTCWHVGNMSATWQKSSSRVWTYVHVTFARLSCHSASQNTCSDLQSGRNI